MRRLSAVILIVVVALLVPMVAAAAESKNDIGVVVGYIGPTADSTIDLEKTKAESTVDYGIAYKHKFLESNRLSLGVNLLFAQHDVKVSGTKIGTIDNMPILLDLNWHFLAKKNLYVGVTAGYAMWGDFKPEGGGESVSVKKNVVYGLNLGWDILLGEHWAIPINVRYLGQKVETDQANVQNETVNVNPIVANVGVSYRF